MCVWWVNNTCYVGNTETFVPFSKKEMLSICKDIISGKAIVWQAAEHKGTTVCELS